MIISLNDFKTWMGMDLTYVDEDDNLTAIISSVDASIKNYCETTFEATVETNEIHDGKNSDLLVTKNSPIISVQEIRFGVTTSGTGGSALDTTSFEARQNYIALKGIMSGVGRCLIAIDYTWGYSSVPADVSLAAKIASEAFYRRLDRKNIGQASRSKKDESESSGGDYTAWDSKTGLPKEVVSMLAPYRSFEMPVMSMTQRSI